MTLKRVGVLSAGKIFGAMYLVLGLFVGGIVSLVALAGASLGGGREALPGILGGVAAIILLPIFYGVLGFFVGIIGSALYNVLAKLLGGIELEFESPKPETLSSAA